MISLLSACSVFRKRAHKGWDKCYETVEVVAKSIRRNKKANIREEPAFCRDRPDDSVLVG